MGPGRPAAGPLAFALAALLASTAAAEPAHTIEPATTPALAPGRADEGRPIDRIFSLIARGTAFAGASVGAEAHVDLLLGGWIGIGAGALVTEDGGGPSIRVHASAIDLNGWRASGYFQYVFGPGFGIGGALSLPVSRRDYVRLGTAYLLGAEGFVFGVGYEWAVWSW